MVKKIKIDFSKVEERAGWNTKHIPEGLHKMKVTGVQETEAGDGTDMLVYSLVPADSRYKTRVFPYYCKLQANQYWKLRDLLVAAGIKVPTKAAMIDPSGPVGKFIAAEVQDDVYQGNVRSQVQGTYDLDILDEDDAPEPDEDEEEYDEEAEDEADDEEYEDEEDEEEDEEDDLNDLTLAELRKLAKSLDIDTAGMKKPDLIEAIEEAQEEADEDDEEDEDEDDLGDEDLDEDDDEYEDDEDEEDEEPEPAPKRRTPAKKAPAKAPAKAAKAAPKRTVRRR